jgi:hypothetical protein
MATLTEFDKLFCLFSYSLTENEYIMIHSHDINLSGIFDNKISAFLKPYNLEKNWAINEYFLDELWRLSGKLSPFQQYALKLDKKNATINKTLKNQDMTIKPKPNIIPSLQKNSRFSCIMKHSVPHPKKATIEHKMNMCICCGKFKANTIYADIILKGLCCLNCEFGMYHGNRCTSNML